MERFPGLRLILRYGTPIMVLFGLLSASLVALVAWPAIGWPAGAIGALVGVLLFGIGRCFVELVTIVTEMLVPR